MPPKLWAAKKCWYIVDVADLAPFARWIPNMAAAMENSTDGAASVTKSPSKAQINQYQGPTTGSTSEVQHCGCDVRPWEDCVHTVPASGAMIAP
jgi:beta-lactamase regulating signal transducer with metallopeptidase domain